MKLQNYDNLPMSFQINQGQSSSEVKYLARGAGYSIFFTSSKTVLMMNHKVDRKQLKNPENNTPPNPEREINSAIVEITLAGANKQPDIEPMDELPGKVNYFWGNDRTKWLTNIPTFSKLKYKDTYPGIDVICYGKQGRLEYDYVVAPNTDPDLITLEIKGVDNMKVNEVGELILETANGELHLKKPYIYQKLNGEKKQISGEYFIKNSCQVSFLLGEYNRDLQLVIDPIVEYSTYLGGARNDQSNSIAIDTAGNAYITGFTTSTDFPTKYAYEPTLEPNGMSAFVTKINSWGSQLVYSTYLGGSNVDTATGITVDAYGNAYVTGYTKSTDFPRVNPIQSSLAGNYDAFVTKLSADSSALIYSTYIGGEKVDQATSIAVDVTGNAMITGYTQSTNFPTFKPLQQDLPGNNHAFVTKINADGSDYVYSTYLGGNGFDFAYSIDTDYTGNAYIAGYTTSDNFPTRNAFQNTLAGSSDAFVTKINAEGSEYIYSTYLGGDGLDEARGIKVDTSGNAYVAGRTESTNYPTKNPIQSNFSGSTDVFISKLNVNGTELMYSTYLGGSGYAEAYAIAIDSYNNAYITGRTGFPYNYPTKNAFQLAPGIFDEAFVTKISSDGSQLIYSSYLGGNGSDIGNGIAVDSIGNAYITGYTNSNDFPTVKPYQSDFQGNYDAFICKVGLTELDSMENYIDTLNNQLNIMQSSIVNSNLGNCNVENSLLNLKYIVDSMLNKTFILGCPHNFEALSEYAPTNTLTTGAVIRDSSVNSLVVAILNNTTFDKLITLAVYDSQKSPKTIIYKKAYVIHHKQVTTIIINRPTLCYELVYAGATPGIYIWTGARKEDAGKPLSDSTFISANTFNHNELIKVIKQDIYRGENQC